MTEKNRFKATIDERQYTIVGDKSPQHMTAVVEIVNQQLQQLKEVAPELSTQDRSILMAVNAISDQLVKEQKIMDLEEQLNELSEQQSTVSRKPKTQATHSQKRRTSNTSKP